MVECAQVTTQTSSVAGGGSSASAYITLRGEHGDYGPCLLERSEGAEGTKALGEGCKDVFDICALDGDGCNDCPSSICLIQVWHERTRLRL